MELKEYKIEMDNDTIISIKTSGTPTEIANVMSNGNKFVTLGGVIVRPQFVRLITAVERIGDLTGIVTLNRGVSKNNTYDVYGELDLKKINVAILNQPFAAIGDVIVNTNLLTLFVKTS